MTSPSQTPSQILLIDDSRTMRQLLRVYLMGGEYAFQEAESGRAGLELLRASLFDLVITDVRMADMDGIEFTTTVRAEEAASGSGRRVPIVLITGDHASDLRARGMRAGADSFLYKPLSSEIVIDAVERLLKAPSSRRRPE